MKDQNQTYSTLFRPILIAAVVLILFFFWIGPLSFFPPPWPDDSVFYLAGIDWLRSPSHYRMLSQSLFVESYQSTNFNTMPGLPFILGLFYQMGITTIHGARILGMIVLGLYIFAFSEWLRLRKLPLSFIVLISMIAVFDPVTRWGSMVIRPEVWQGLFFMMCIIEIDLGSQKLEPSRLSNRISIYLALAAYIHFEAIYLVPAIALGILAQFTKKAIPILLSIATKTILLLSPWLIYVFSHFSEFKEQMTLQFARLQGHNPFTQSLYGLFHSLYLGMFMPVSYPKFLNIAKVLFWFGMSAGVFFAGRSYKKNCFKGSTVTLLVALCFFFFLWIDKPETWFVMLIHMVAFPWIASALEDFRSKPLLNFILILFLGVEVAVAGYQFKKTNSTYKWNQYQTWVDCIDRSIGSRKEVWQASYPDALIDLAGKNRDRNYYRDNDFMRPETEGLKRKALDKLEVIYHSVSIPLDSPLIARNYDGDATSDDLYFVTKYPWMPDAAYSAPNLGGPWRSHICQNGPFWALISIKN